MDSKAQKTTSWTQLDPSASMPATSPTGPSIRPRTSVSALSELRIHGGQTGNNTTIPNLLGPLGMSRSPESHPLCSTVRPFLANAYSLCAHEGHVATLWQRAAHDELCS